MEIQVDGESIEVQQHPEFSCYAASADGRIFTRPALRIKGVPKGSPYPRANYWREVSTFTVQPRYTPPYLKCRVTQDGKSRLVLVHRFILECWKGIKPKHVVTRHLDGDPLNNRLDNLKYGTVQENVYDAFEHTGNYAEGENNGRASLTESDVREIRRRFDSGERVASISRDFPQVGKTSVENAAKRKTWPHIA